MADLVVIVPSRGRPDAVAELAQAFADTCTAETRLVIVLDESDPLRPAYYEAPKDVDHSGRTTYFVVARNEPGTMVGALNEAATFAADSGDWFALAFLGDDHRPRTKGWDAAYLAALRELGTGIVYGNDLLQGENLPTQCAMTADVVRTLGYMAPAGLRHMYVDNFWRDLGQGADCLRYLPDVIVEHMHPVAGKAEWTEGHRRVNASHIYERDAAEYGRFTRHELPGAVDKVRALRGAHA